MTGRLRFFLNRSFLLVNHTAVCYTLNIRNTKGEKIMKINIKRATAAILAASVFAIASSAFADNTTLYENEAATIEEKVTNIMESLCGITTSTDGTKHGILYQMKDGVETQDATLYTAYNNPDVLEYISKNDSELREVASYVFSDVTSDAWYSSFVPIAAYFKVLSGYDDGTLKPDNNITAAELAKVVSSAFEANIENEYWDRLDDGTNNWYGKYYHSCAKAFTYTHSTDMTSNYFDRAVTRAEIAYVLANYVDAGSGELQEYIDKAKSGDISSLSRFTDTINLSTEDDGTCEKDIDLLSQGYVPSRYAGALAYLADKGVFEGDENGALHPTDSVRRSEVFTLITKTVSKVESYSFGQFSNPTEGNTVSSGSTSTSSTSHSSHSSEEYETTKTGVNAGKPTWQSQGTWEEQNSREPMTLRYDDPTRPAAIEGDIFIAPDGNSYELHRGDCGILGEDLILSGVKLSLDEGRQSVNPNLNETNNTVKNGYQALDSSFGWLDDDIHTSQCSYIVRNGVGLWDAQWISILNVHRPTENGTYNGERDSTGFFYWDAMMNMWNLVGQD